MALTEAANHTIICLLFSALREYMVSQDGYLKALKLWKQLAVAYYQQKIRMRLCYFFKQKNCSKLQSHRTM